MRRRTKIIIGLLLMAVVIGWPVVAHYRLKNRVAEYRRQLAAQGEKMTITELTPLLPPDRDNGAVSLVSATWQFGSINGSNQPPTMRVILPGHALVAWQRAILPSSESTNVWSGLRDEIEAKRDELGDMRMALKKPALVMNLDYAQGFSLSLPHLATLKRITQWFSAATMLDLREGRFSDTVANIRGMTALVSHYQNEPVAISSLVRFAIAAIAVSTIWEALQSPDWNDEQLAALQRGWEAVDFMSQAESALGMERAVNGNIYAELRASPRSLTTIGQTVGGSSSSGLKEFLELSEGVLNDPGKGFKDLFQRYPAYWAWRWWWSYEDELVQMQYIQAALTALREARVESCFTPALDRCAQACRNIRQAHPKAGSLFDFGFGAVAEDYLTRVRTVEIQRHLLVTAIALKRSHLRHGHHPEALAALVPEFCQATPRDPVDGQPLRYRRQEDGSFLLYSVGENGVDDGGDPSPPETHKTPRHWLKARDVVWPQPASAQEAMLYELEAEGERDKQRIRSRVVVTNDMPLAVLTQLERLAKNYHFTLTNNAAMQP